MRRSVRLAAALLAVAVALGCGRAAQPLVTGPGLVALIVLDTVRADHLSLCGYARPTSPALDALAHSRATWTCDAYTPETWTLPSHASFFTGVSVPEHGAHYSPEGRDVGWGARVFPLDDRLPTLAEMLGHAGYRSLAVSGNPVISDETGLARGFERVVRAGSFGELYGPALIRALDHSLAEIPEDAPLFLFLNIADAHHPWPAIPEGTGWLPARRGMNYRVDSEQSPWRRYMAGQMKPGEAAELVAQNVDLYDWGVRRADETLAAALALLERRGRMRAGYRIAITADHGEFLGQHGLTGHCCYTWEAVTRVPFLALTSGPKPELSRPFAALHAHHWLRDGRMPASDGTVTSVGYPSANLARHTGRVGHELSVALWHGHEKLLWIDGRVSRFDVAADPQELHALEAAQHPLAGQLEQIARAAQRSGLAAEAQPGEDAALRHLGALGYVD